MKLRTLSMINALLTFQTGYSQNMVDDHKNYTIPGLKSIIILADVPKDYFEDSIILQMRSVKYQKGLEWIKTEEKVKNGKVKWVLQNEKPIMISSPGYYAMFEPGDSISITYNESGKPVYSGRGAEKFDLVRQLEYARNTIPKPSYPKSHYFSTVSLQDYIDWMVFLDKQLESIWPLLESNKSNISPYALYFLKTAYVCNIEFERLQKFQSLMHRAEKFGVTKEQLCSLFDTIAALPSTKWLASLSEASPDIHYYYHFVRVSHARKYNFDLSHDSLSNEANRKISYYHSATKLFRDETLESLLSYLLIDGGFAELGFPPQIEMLLEQYNQRQGYLEYKEHVKKMEKYYRSQLVKKEKRAPDFQIEDENGNTHSKSSLQGKIAIVSFQKKENEDCIKTRYVLDRIENKFSSSASTDIKFIHLYPSGINNSILKQFNILQYPTVYMIDADGRFLTDPITGYSDSISEQVTSTIKRQLVLLQDGPYIFNNNSESNAYLINSKKVTPVKPGQNERKLKTFSAQTDLFNKEFNFKLKSKHQIEPSTFDNPGKLLAISDIEGNFDALRKLLQANNVIDNDFNWTFGNGHLVFNGDIFDRGKQVTECLWLIYSLEEKAKAAGGYVHFIMGNHEIMNLNGDTRYVQKKYLENAKKLGKKYTELYNEQTELGEWLRTKNIMEKIGNLLFVHAGISEQVNKLPMDIGSINNAARAWYDKDSSARNSHNKSLVSIFDQTNSPFWFRMYYLDQEVKVLSNFDTLYKAPAAQIDITLKKFDVSRIVTGHTIVSESINLHYNGKVINIDTPHKYGKSEALLIEGEKYFRVNDTGEKFPLTPANIAGK